MIYTRFSQLVQVYHRLGTGDAFVGQVPSSHLKSAILADLTARGVQLIPSALAQTLNASKVAQAFALNPWMLPHTLAITRRKELMDALGRYHREGICAAVTKEDRLHCGHGIRKWDNLEMLYSCMGLDRAAYPFVLQPFVESFVDVRIVLVDDFCEAYIRSNTYNFRMNLSNGGESYPHEISTEQHNFCLKIMERAQMPFAHIDLMLMDSGAIYLSEIRLNGGIHGARVNRRTLDEIKQARLMALAQRATETNEANGASNYYVPEQSKRSETNEKPKGGRL